MIELRGLSKGFDRTTAVHPLDLKIEEGSFMAIVGPSGCGKSTLLNLIAGLEKPTSGEIYFDGKPVTNLSPKQRDVAFVFQSYALYPHKTAYENIAFPLSVAKTNKVEIEKRVREVSELLDIDELLERKPKELSGGQRQRVALGRAIIRKPKVFLLDEPLSNLDARLRVQTRAELKKLHQRLKTTFIYVTHDQTEAMSLADTIGILRDGHLLQMASPKEIYNHPADMFVASFIGNPGMNFIKGKLTDNGNAVTIENKSFDLKTKVDRQGDIIFGLRPEHITITDNELPGSLKASINVVEPLGSEVLVEVKIGDSRVVIRANADFNGKTGYEIYISLDMNKAVFFDVESGRKLYK
ncbi:MAG: ABC transporter ATP-binding protein [candidate division Zixibacteria bacterium]|nr:ABC transporter ATP-binding protein [candidate division Zixibacteria bacterium]